MTDGELSAAIAPLSPEPERREREKVEALEGRPFEKEQKGTEMPGMQRPADARREKGTTGLVPTTES